MGWKKLILFAIMLIYLIDIGISQPFGPPLYIANPESLECRYYFAGDEKHSNPRPENFTINIGYTTEFKNQEQACQLYRCVKSGGKVLLTNKDDSNPNICQCPPSLEFVNESGCTFIAKTIAVKEKSSTNIFSRIWNWILGLLGLSK